MSAYKVIIFDLDGTAIPNKPNGMPSQRLVEAIRAAKPRIRLCAATGRPITNARPILDALGIDEPCIIAAGTQIINPGTGELLWQASIETADIQKILELCAPYDYELLAGNELLGEGGPAGQRSIEGEVNVMYLMGCASEDATIILERLAAIPTVTAAGVTSWTHQGVDIHITHSQATKEHAIAELLAMLGLTKEDAIGIGDADNDIHLFRGVGHKVAMGNATDLLKSQADEICASVDDDGLADIIRNYS